MRYLLLSVLVVCVIGVMIPSAYSASLDELEDKIPSPTRTALGELGRTAGGNAGIFWTDKEAYQKGDTVTVYGIFSPQYMERLDNSNRTLKAKIQVEAEMHWGGSGPLDFSPIITPDHNGYFSTTFTLSGDNYPADSDLVFIPGGGGVPKPGEGDYLRYFFRIISDPAYRGSNIFGGVNFFVNPQEKETGEVNFEIINDSDGVPNEFAFSHNFYDTRNISPFGCSVRLVMPSGLIYGNMYLEGTTKRPNTCGMSYSNTHKIPTSLGGYGTYEIQVFVGSKTFTKIFDVPKPEPRIAISTASWKDNHVRGDLISVAFTVWNADPNKTNLNYRLLDPNGDVVLSETVEFDHVFDDDILGTEFYNSVNLYWAAYLKDRTGQNSHFDTSTFPEIHGLYTVEASYDGIVDTKSFNFEADHIFETEVMKSTQSQNLANCLSQYNDARSNLAKQSMQGDLDFLAFNNALRDLENYYNEKCSKYKPTSTDIESEPASESVVESELKSEVSQTSGGCGAGTVLVNGVCQLAPTGSDTGLPEDYDPLFYDVMLYYGMTAAQIIGVAVAAGGGIIVVIFVVRKRSKTPKPAKQELDEYEEQYLAKEKPKQKPVEKKETSAFCENCGNTLNPKAKFCGSCGNQV